MQRRNFLKTMGAGTLIGGICGCGGSTRAIDDAPVATTLDYTVAGPPRLVTSYTRLTRGPGQALTTLSLPGVAPAAGRETRRQGLACFAHLTDIHIVDPGSPGRLPFSRQFEWAYPPNSVTRFIGAFRATEALSTHVVDAMVRRINALRKGPATGRPIDMTVSTGDNADSGGAHELKLYLTLLAGGTVVPDSGGNGHEGLQSARADIPPEVYQGFWHPDPPPAGRAPDLWKSRWGYPEYPGLMAAASRSYRAEGLAMPWYSGFGNHDGLNQGIYAETSGPARFMDYFAERGELPVGFRPGEDPARLIEGIETLAPEAPLDPFVAATLTVPVKASGLRRRFSRREFAQMHLDLASRAGPPGHGYDAGHVRDDRLYFSFEVAPGVKGIMLDTTCMLGDESGWLDMAQARWLERELAAVHGRHYDANGQLLATGNRDQLCLVFSHHTSDSMHNFGGRGFSADKPNPAVVRGRDYIQGPELVALLHRFPNVLAWVNGHTHHNRITMHEAPPGRRQSGFWEINTAAHIDFPQQARVIEVADNRDGTLSIFTVLLDHSDPQQIPAPGSPAADFDSRQLAAVALELSANDRTARAHDDRVGRPQDRNVELVMQHPFR